MQVHLRMTCESKAGPEDTPGLILLSLKVILPWKVLIQVREGL